MTAAGRVVLELEGRIADGTFPPGSKLPGETVLARRLGVSRPTVREALRSLAARRLVRIRPRSGTYVATQLPREVGEGREVTVPVGSAEFWELLEIRRIVEIAVAELAARRRTLADLAELGRAAAALKQPERATVRTWEMFFATLARATHNVLLPGLEESLWRSLEQPLARSLELLGEEKSREEDLSAELVEIYERVEDGDPMAARETTQSHLRHLERILRNG